jgi:hypothetical protein
MCGCTNLWEKRNKTYQHGRLLPIRIIKATKILTRIEQIIKDQNEALGKDEDKFFADNAMLELRNKLADGITITETIIKQIECNEDRTRVSNLMQTTVDRFVWVIQQRLVSLRYIAINAKYTCFGDCQQVLSDLDTEQCISWEELSEQGKVTEANLSLP